MGIVPQIWNGDRVRHGELAVKIRHFTGAMIGLTLLGCADPAYESAFNAYKACLNQKQSVEACQLEKAQWDAEAQRAQIETNRSRSAPVIYTAPPPAPPPPPTVQVPPLPPMSYPSRR